MAVAPHDLGNRVYLIDVQFVHAEYAASYLVRGRDGWAFVEVGTSHSTPLLLDALAALGVDRAAVSHVIVTHVHLDHAGGAGSLMQALPNARLLVHPRGARHLADPTALIAGATQVYGKAEVERTYGEILPVPAERIVAAEDGLVVDLGERPLTLLDAPGHAKHHLVVVDPASGGVFTGDNFGLAYPSLAGPTHRLLFPTTTPIQFDPEALHRTIDRIMATAPRRLYLTHFGVLDRDLPRYAAILHRLVDAHAAVARAVGPGPQAEGRIRDALADLFVRELALQGIAVAPAAALALWGPDLQLNAQGLAVWLGKAGS